MLFTHRNRPSTTTSPLTMVSTMAATSPSLMRFENSSMELPTSSRAGTLLDLIHGAIKTMFSKNKHSDTTTTTTARVVNSGGC